MGPGRGQVLVWGAAAVLAVLAVVRIAGGQGEGQATPVPASGSVSQPGDRRTGAGAEPGGAGSERSNPVYVHVAGRVRRPGLYRLAAGSRVASALNRAGGPARGADLAAINLAAKVEDGQQVLVPRSGAAGAAAGVAGVGAGAIAPGAAGRAKLSLGTASAEQLDQLDGIGPTLAKRIVEYRAEHGGFRSLNDLNQVEGIGEKRMQALRKAVGP
jgi:competence protein ComEA